MGPLAIIPQTDQIQFSTILGVFIWATVDHRKDFIEMLLHFWNGHFISNVVAKWFFCHVKIGFVTTSNVTVILPIRPLIIAKSICNRPGWITPKGRFQAPRASTTYEITVFCSNSQVGRSSYLVYWTFETITVCCLHRCYGNVVTMATEGNLNNSHVSSRRQFIFGTQVLWDNDNLLFTPLLWETLLPWQQRKTLITRLSQVGRSSYLVHRSFETMTICCLHRCYGKRCYHGNRGGP